MKTIVSSSFYSNYHGHTLPHLKILAERLDKTCPRIYLAGDSVLDNKYWILSKPKATALNGYENILTPPESVCDVSYWLNKYLLEQGLHYVAINTAVEEASIGDKSSSLNPSDLFIRDNLTENDIIVISLGGNDIALKPNLQTVWEMGKLILTSSVDSIEDYTKKPNGFDYLVKLFTEGTVNYLKNMTKDFSIKPKQIIITTLYYFGIHGKGWADTTLNLVGYNRNPALIQAILRRLTYEMEQRVSIPRIKILPLWKCMDGTNEEDYVDRVEPSVSGGEKIAKYIVSNLNVN